MNKEKKLSIKTTIIFSYFLKCNVKMYIKMIGSAQLSSKIYNTHFFLPIIIIIIIVIIR